jgi:hypothetical protein
MKASPLLRVTIRQRPQAEVSRRFFADFAEFANVVNWWLADSKSRWRLQELPNAVLRLNVPDDSPTYGRRYALYYNQTQSGRLEIQPCYKYSAENPEIFTDIEIDNPRLLGMDDIMDVFGALELHVTIMGRSLASRSA